MCTFGLTVWIEGLTCMLDGLGGLERANSKIENLRLSRHIARLPLL